MNSVKPLGLAVLVLILGAIFAAPDAFAHRGKIHPCARPARS